MELSFRSLGVSDLDLLMDWRIRVLEEVFDTSLNNLKKEALIEANRKYLQAHLTDGSHLSLLVEARENGQLKEIGCGDLCFWSEMPSPDNLSGKCAYLMNIFVLPQYRHHSIGSKLVHTLIEEAKHRGISKIYLETTDLGRPVYEKNGFVPLEDYLIYHETKDRN